MGPERSIPDHNRQKDKRIQLGNFVRIRGQKNAPVEEEIDPRRPSLLHRLSRGSQASAIRSRPSDSLFRRSSGSVP
ncbi:hypothetical protein GW17_00049838 [Ensete ventricosum]|nr:hypothetical protein GW17_00049838 [Ensete ventricosum]